MPFQTRFLAESVAAVVAREVALPAALPIYVSAQIAEPTVAASAPWAEVVRLTCRTKKRNVTAKMSRTTRGESDFFPRQRRKKCELQRFFPVCVHTCEEYASMARQIIRGEIFEIFNRTRRDTATSRLDFNRR